MPRRAQPSLLGVFVCIALVGVKLAFDNSIPAAFQVCVVIYV